MLLTRPFFYRWCLTAATAVFMFFGVATAQNGGVGINTDGTDPSPDAMLDVKATNKGVLIPRVSIDNLNNKAPITSLTPTVGLLVYNTNALTGKGFYYWNESSWIGVGNERNWGLKGNSITSTDFLGSTNNQPLRFRVYNNEKFQISTLNQLLSFNNGSALRPAYSWNDNQNMGLFRAGSGVLGFSTTGVERMRIYSGGQVVFNNSISLFANAIISNFAYGVNDGIISQSQNGTAIQGQVLNGSQGTAIVGINDGTLGLAGAFYINSTISDQFALFANTNANISKVNAAGVWGQSNGLAGGVFLAAGQSANAIGLNGQYIGGGTRDAIGVLGLTNSVGINGIGVLGQGNNWGVFSNGDFGATGGKFFVIDHPLDPENKFLRHASIESPEILNMYRGTVELDETGSAMVELPSYFSSININFSYQLTPVGASMPQLFVAKEIEEGKFEIAGGAPSKKVSWVVYAERNDRWLQQRPQSRIVELDKKPHEKGKYLRPELYGQPKEMGIFNVEREMKDVKSEPAKSEDTEGGGSLHKREK